MAEYCANHDQSDAEIEEWIRTSEGLQMLGQWGAQCAYYTQMFSRAIFGRSQYDTHGYGNAKDIIDNANRDYFDVIWNDPSRADLLPRRGDIIIWEGKPLWNGGVFGHIAIVLYATASNVTVLQLDGATAPTRLYPDGHYYSVKPVHRATFRYINDPGVGNVRGWIRAKPHKVVYSGADQRGYGFNRYTPGKPSTYAPAADKAAAKEQVVKNFIDVSNHQPTSVVRDVDTEAVVIKATEGVGWSDKHLAGHVAAAKAKGIPYMLYHFARASSNASDPEAKWFLEVAKPYLDDPLFAGLVLDWEEDSVMHYAAWPSDFLARIHKDAPDVHTVLYTRTGFLKANGWREVDKSVPVWIAWYGTTNTFHGYATDFAGAPKDVNGFTIAAWQYSDQGRLSGYSGNLDLNRSLSVRADRAMWPAGVQDETEKDEFWEFLMAMDEKRFREINSADTRMSINHMFSPHTDDGRKMLDNLADAMLDRKVTLEGIHRGGGTTSLRTKIAHQGSEFHQIKSLVSELEAKSGEDNKAIAVALLAILEGE